MKKLLFLTLITILAVASAQAQKWCYIDTEYMLSQMPEYKTAQDAIDAASQQWQKEIEAKYAEIDKLYRTFQSEQVLLSDDMKRKREEEIIEREKEAKEMQKGKFGVDGELFKKRQEMVKPLQDKIYNAVKELATSGQYAAIFDKSSDFTMLYANPKYDKSDELLEKMGYKKKVKEEHKAK